MRNKQKTNTTMAARRHHGYARRRGGRRATHTRRAKHTRSTQRRHRHRMTGGGGDTVDGSPATGFVINGAAHDPGCMCSNCRTLRGEHAPWIHPTIDVNSIPNLSAVAPNAVDAQAVANTPPVIDVSVPPAPVSDVSVPPAPVSDVSVWSAAPPPPAAATTDAQGSQGPQGFGVAPAAQASASNNGFLDSMASWGQSLGLTGGRRHRRHGRSHRGHGRRRTQTRRRASRRSHHGGRRRRRATTRRRSHRRRAAHHARSAAMHGGSFIADDLVSMGRMAGYSAGSAYDSLVGATPDVNPMPWKDQMLR